MSDMIERAGIAVDPALAAFVEREILAPLALEQDVFWTGFARILGDFVPRNRALLDKREVLQRQIDEWHRARRGQPHDGAAYRRFLEEIGYLVPEPAPFTIGTQNVDREIATMAGPQLVVPVLNARFLLNAANARWGSLYDALYGTDALDAPPARPGGYDEVRGAAVIAAAKAFLDQAVPLAQGSWADLAGEPVLADPSRFIGETERGLLYRHNGLHIEVRRDPASAIGKSDPAGISDVVLEAALTTICDLEDSIAAVDAEDKLAAYRNWLGVIRGDLADTFEKGGRSVTRRLADDLTVRPAQAEPVEASSGSARPSTSSGRADVDGARSWEGGGPADEVGAPPSTGSGRADAGKVTLPGRSLLFVRNVGHLMTTPAMRWQGQEIPEGIMDAIITSAIGAQDVRGLGQYRNSRTGSIYIVKPKQHGPEECAFTNDLFDAVEDLLDLPLHTIKVGVMDEERRTSANLAACIHAVRDRIVFINTGFLDRTGDEMHTSMQAGPMLRKGAMKTAPWLTAYEARNVAIGLACGLSGKAQIGKGMWAAPDKMADMMVQKIAHLEAGANTAWVPSPTAATLHAMHYHRLDVFKRQQVLQTSDPLMLSLSKHGERSGKVLRQAQDERGDGLTELLTIPLADGVNWSEEEIRDELDNNCQGLLGYVVRWIDAGVGCSKVPDIHDVGLMEDRATLRISSQHIANWLLHGVVGEDQVLESLRRMAAKVDQQNAGDPAYVPLADNEDGPAFCAARALIFTGVEQPSGYTEPLLHAWRAKAKGTR